MLGHVSFLSVEPFSAIVQSSRATPIEHLAHHHANELVDALDLSALNPQYKGSDLLNIPYELQGVFTCPEQLVNFADSSEGLQAGVCQGGLIDAQGEGGWNAIAPRDKVMHEPQPAPIAWLYNFCGEDNGNA